MTTVFIMHVVTAVLIVDMVAAMLIVNMVAAVLVVNMTLVIMTILFILFHEGGVNFNQLVKAERVQTQNLIEGGTRALRLNQTSERVDGSDTVLHFLELIGRHQIDLVQNNTIREGNLVLGFIDVAVRLLLIKMDTNMLGVNQAHDAVNAEVILQQRVGVEGENNGGRIGQTSRLQENALEILSAADQHSKGSHQIASDRAANAAIIHGNNVFLGSQILADQSIINSNFSKLIFNNTNLPLRLFTKNVIDQSGLSTSQKASHDCDRSLVLFVRHDCKITSK